MWFSIFTEHTHFISETMLLVAENAYFEWFSHRFNTVTTSSLYMCTSMYVDNICAGALLLPKHVFSGWTCLVEMVWFAGYDSSTQNACRNLRLSRNCLPMAKAIRARNLGAVAQLFMLRKQSLGCAYGCKGNSFENIVVKNNWYWPTWTYFQLFW